MAARALPILNIYDKMRMSKTAINPSFIRQKTKFKEKYAPFIPNRVFAEINIRFFYFINKVNMPSIHIQAGVNDVKISDNLTEYVIRFVTFQKVIAFLFFRKISIKSERIFSATIDPQNQANYSLLRPLIRHL